MTEEWLTYRQAGDRLQMSPEAVRQRARRLGWRHMRGNDGRALILVPPDVVAEHATVQSGVHRPDKRPDEGAVETALNILRDQLERMQKAAEDERQQHVAERTRLLDDLEAARVAHQAEIEAERTRSAEDAAWYRGEIERMQAKLDEFETRTWWQRLWRRG
jgi:hypothetical protein